MAPVFPTVRRRHPRRPGPGVPAVDALRLPEGMTARSLFDLGGGNDRGEEGGEPVAEWVRGSPDHTLYHLPPFIDFLRNGNGVADVLLIARDGMPLFALPVHGWDATGLDGGYSGVVFPAGAHEATLRRSVAGLWELLQANRRVPVRICQSAQARAYEDPARVTLLQCLLEEAGVELEPMYCRLRSLEDLPGADEIQVGTGHLKGALALDGDWLAGETLDAYDHGTRKKIRNAVAGGLTVEYVRAGEPAAREQAYECFQPVHAESWTRTGLLPKPPGYWPAMSAAVAAGGGRDLVVLVRDRDARPLAGVLCHAYHGRAIYLSGCTTAAGLSKQANPLCMHAAILACRREGVATYELGRFHADERSTKERSVTRYKAHFGGELVRVASFRSRANLPGRARAGGAGIVSEGMRRFSVALGRARRGRRA